MKQQAAWVHGRIVMKSDVSKMKFRVPLIQNLKKKTATEEKPQQEIL